MVSGKIFHSKNDKKAESPSLYFAYGSNMSHAQMQTRCPDLVFIGAVRLEGYRFVYDGYEEYRKGAVANIVPDADPGADPNSKGIVWGGLYKVTPENIANLV